MSGLSASTNWRRFKFGQLGLLALFIGEIALMSALIPGYFSLDGLLFASQGFVEAGIIALGMTLVIVAGGLDISVGSLLGLVVVAVGYSSHAGLPLPFAMVVGLLAGTAGGALNGSIIALLRMNPLVVTLGTFALFRGIALAISNSLAVSGFPEWFQFLGQGTIGIVPIPLIVLVILAVVFHILLTQTLFGRVVYAVGSNALATQFSGRDPDRIRLAVYTLQGFLVGVAGILYCARVSSARGTEGLGLEFVVITMVIFGGARITGGHGSITGTVLGGLIIWYLQDGISFAGIRSDWGLVITGLFLLAGVLFNENRNALGVMFGLLTDRHQSRDDDGSNTHEKQEESHVESTA